MVEGPDVPPTRICLERNAQCFKGAIQLAGRKKPLRARQRKGLFVSKPPRYRCYLVEVKCPNLVQLAIRVVFRGGGT